ncbi:MAG: damage-control phosphatase ARMT1 family protein [Candidatus Zhuqueibacterota bacterium]
MAIDRIEATYACVTCAIGSLVTLFEKGLVPEAKKDLTMRAVLKYFSDLEYKQSPPRIGKEMHRVIREVIGNDDPYKEVKAHFNQFLLDQLPELKQRVIAADDPFQLALRLAIAGNIIDFGPNEKFDIDATMEKAKSVSPAIDDSEGLRRAISGATSILYLGDNAGEIVMDRLFLETIRHPNVYFAVRHSPIINDVTFEDARMVGIDRMATVISNGDNAPGTILENTSAEFQELFNGVDLIISKGQGNFEGLSVCQRNIYFLLMVKCDHVGSFLKVKKGDFVVKKGNAVK